jgi:putative SOS response-associated peptidase YedK
VAEAWPRDFPDYEPEPEPAIEEAGPGDLFDTAPKPARTKKAPKSVKRVFAITTVEPGPFAFAGIWDAWKRPDGTYLETFAIVTTEPNELVAQIHDRLALILHPRDYDRWLGIDDKGGDPRPPFDLLHPFDADKMKMTPANPAVGNWRNNGPEMLNPPC